MPFGANIYLLVSFFKSIIVVKESFAQSIIFFSFLKNNALEKDKNVVSNDDTKQEKWSRVISHEERVYMSHCVFNVMVWQNHIWSFINLNYFLFKDLTISKLPKDERQHKNWNPLNEIHCIHSNFFIKTGRLSVIVAHKNSFIEEQYNEGEESNNV